MTFRSPFHNYAGSVMWLSLANHKAAVITCLRSASALSFALFCYSQDICYYCQVKKYRLVFLAESLPTIGHLWDTILDLPGSSWHICMNEQCRCQLSHQEQHCSGDSQNHELNKCMLWLAPNIRVVCYTAKADM